VVVSLIDRPKSTLELGAGFSTSEGVGVEALWNRYNRLGRADTFTVTLRMAELEQRLGAQLALPNWGKPARTLTLGSNILQEQTDAYDRAGIDFHADLKQRFGKTSFFTYGGAIEFTRTNEPEFDPRTGETIGVERQLVIVSALAGLSLDRSNDPLDPTHGWRFNGEARPTLVTGDESLGYLRAQGQVTGYWPFGREARTVLAGRLRLGTILGGDIPGVPAPQRFYSGGGGSVRGYDYQGIGPRLPNGAPLGGLSLFETSIELRQQLFGKWGGAVFLDGGSVGEDATPTFSDVRWAGGFGVRYRLPFGPVRADVAFPFDRSGGQSTFQLYISIGQAF
jgi:translocation and assembly module TamA